jgi:lanosterol synthase
MTSQTPSLPQTNDASALERGAAALALMQHADGRWEGECVWCPMLTAQYVITAHVIGLKIPRQRRRRIVTHFRATQNEAGIWGLHPFDDGSLFVTTLVYVAARLLDASRNEPWLHGARRLFHEQGGVQRIPTWGKVWLAVVGLYRWEGINPILPELWLLPSWVPIHPANYYCHTRSIYSALAVLYGQRLVARSTPIVDAIRDELYQGGFAMIDFASWANEVREEDAPFKAGVPLRFLYGLSRLYERLGLRGIRNQAIHRLRGHMLADLRASNHLSLSPVNGLLAILALWSDDPDNPDLKCAIEGLEAWFWEDAEQGSRIAGAGSVCWDTAFALQALSLVPSVAPGSITGGAAFLASQQIERSDFDHRAAYRIDPVGGWCFSEVRHCWPVSDCTAEALLALLDAEPECIGREGTARAVRFILRCQNRDGGFGSYEPSKTSFSLEWLNPSEMFGRCMTERSYVECTASCLMALTRVQKRYPDLLRARIATAIARAHCFLLVSQNADGTWDAAWGVHYIYGTMFGVRGLLAGGAGPTDEPIRKACRWLLARQRPDGSWGEHHSSCTAGCYVEGHSGLAVQTAWALITLVEANDPDQTALARAAGFLESAQQSSGQWPDGQFVGLFFETALLNYRLYRQYFPIMALARAHRHFTQCDRRGRTHASTRSSSRPDTPT